MKTRDSKNKIISLNIPVGNIISILKQLSREDKEFLYSFLEDELFKPTLNEPEMTYLASEKSLSKDWSRSEEDEAWKNL
jgi:hypothetical protein